MSTLWPGSATKPSSDIEILKRSLVKVCLPRNGGTLAGITPCATIQSDEDDSATERLMPSIPDITGPYRFFFYSFDCGEPMHVHVVRDRDNCKFWLEPLALAGNRGFAAKELNRIRSLIAQHSGVIRDAWNEHCGRA